MALASRIGMWVCGEPLRRMARPAPLFLTYMNLREHDNFYMQ